MISVVILTKNEEIDIFNCLESVVWSNDVHVLDSGSTDQTLEIASRFNAIISTNAFISFGQQRNFALDELKIRNEWILFLDADEVVTTEFKDEILRLAKNASDDVAGFYCCWRMILEGKWLKYCDNFPKWQFRLMRRGRARFTDFGHGQKEDKLLGRAEYVKIPYIHYGFSKGWSHWLDRHNRYSTLEARSRLFCRPPFKNIFSSNSSKRNTALKSWLSRMPGWPVLRFLQAYFLNLGIVEGVPGLIYCANMAYYEFLIQIKIRELKRKPHID